MFIELSEMGAAILGYSAIKKAKEIFVNSQIYFLIFRENAGSVYVLDIIPRENIFTIRGRNLWPLIYDTLKVLVKIRKEKIEVAIDMELFSRFTSLLSYLSGAKVRVGFYKFSLEGLYRADIYTHKVMYNSYMHISKNFLALVEALKENKDIPLIKRYLADGQTTVPKIESSQDATEKILDKLKIVNNQIGGLSKIVILNLGVGEYLPLRKWPIENYIKLAKRLLQDEGIFIVLIGLKSESQEVDKIRSLLDSGRCINFMGKTTIKEFVDLCNISRLLISHDSGAVNLASLTSINIVVLFGPETPILYAPLSINKTVFYKNFACSPCFLAYNHRTSFCRDNRCLQAITVDEVYEAARRYLCIDK